MLAHVLHFSFGTGSQTLHALPTSQTSHKVSILKMDNPRKWSHSNMTKIKYSTQEFLFLYPRWFPFPPSRSILTTTTRGIQFPSIPTTRTEKPPQKTENKYLLQMYPTPLPQSNSFSAVRLEQRSWVNIWKSPDVSNLANSILKRFPTGLTQMRWKARQIREGRMVDHKVLSPLDASTVNNQGVLERGDAN